MTDDRLGDEISQPFDYDEWLESVAGQEIVLDAPDGFPNVPKAFYLPRWAQPHREFYCAECDRMRFPVFLEWWPPKHRCPVCGSNPGALELGTDGTLTDVRPNDL